MSSCVICSFVRTALREVVGQKIRPTTAESFSNIGNVGDIRTNAILKFTIPESLYNLSINFSNTTLEQQYHSSNSTLMNFYQVTNTQMSKTFSGFRTQQMTDQLYNVHGQLMNLYEN